MSWLFAFGGVLSAWALLRIMGNERDCRLREIKDLIDAEKADKIE